MTINHNMYIEPGYWADGYMSSPCSVALTYGSTRINLRGPSIISGTVRMLQPEEYSTGWERFVYDPRAIIHTMTLQYNRLSLAERDDLDAYFDLIDFSAAQSYGDVNEGNTYPIWFDKPEISFEETYYRCYRSSITIWGYQAFHPTPIAPADISVLLGADRYPEQITRTKRQPRIWLSDGSSVVYNKATMVRRTTTRSLRLTRNELGSLIFHYVTAGGPRNTWGWEGRTCRYAEQEMSWQRSTINTGNYDVQLTIEDDL